MKYTKWILASVISVLMLSSCSNYYTFSAKRTASFTPNLVQLNVDIDDFEYLGQTEISVISRNYLGFIQVIDTVNNRLYNYRDIRVTDLNGPRDLRLSGEMKKAAHKVVDEFPEATYYIVSSDYLQINRLFLGKKVNRRMEIQAYKFKIENN
jgi:hypothetical protein